jgi:hypothetical protein
MSRVTLAVLLRTGKSNNSQKIIHGLLALFAVGEI